MNWQPIEGNNFSDDYRALVGWDNIHRWVVIGNFFEATGKWHDDHMDKPFFPQPSHYMPMPDAPNAYAGERK